MSPSSKGLASQCTVEGRECFGQLPGLLKNNNKTKLDFVIRDYRHFLRIFSLEESFCSSKLLTEALWPSYVAPMQVC